jgi:hypothetical protein
MKTPWYESSPGATAALLATGIFVDVDCYSVTLAGGGMLGATELLYSAGPVDVAVPGGPAFSAAGPLIGTGNSASHAKVGLDVDEWELVVAPRPVDVLTGARWPDKIGTESWLAAAQAGVLDHADVQVDRAIAAAWPALGAALVPTGVVTIFAGRVGEVDVGRSQCAIKLYSYLKALGQVTPHNLFQASCTHTLFDAGCTLNPASFARTGTVAGLGSAANVFTSSVVAPAGSRSYALGRVVMTSGASRGFARAVRDWSPGSPGIFTLLKEFPFGIAPGDGFTAYPGCDKQYGTCALFQNQANFGGCLSIPVPETAV